MANTKPWRLDPAEIESGWFASSSGKKGQMARREKLTACTLFIIHRPTGIRLEGSIPEGHYSKKTMQLKRAALQEELLAQLEQAVAKALKIPGR